VSTERTGKASSRAARAVRRLPFTLIILITMGLIAVATNSSMVDLSRHLFRHVAFSARDLWLLRWGRLFTSALVTTGGPAFWEGLAFVAVSVGPAEWLAGTWRAGSTFWGVHVLSLVLESLLIALPLHQLDSALGTALFVSRDVGASAGGFGCLGLACARLPKPWRWVTGGVIMAGLLALLALALWRGQKNVNLININLGHSIAFPLGWLSSGLGSRRDVPRKLDDGVGDNGLGASHKFGETPPGGAL
jgi:hypothetical protein